jgi:hypothetical protein
MYVPVLETCSFGCMPAGQPDNLGVDGTVRGAPASAGKQPCPILLVVQFENPYGWRPMQVLYFPEAAAESDSEWPSPPTRSDLKPLIRVGSFMAKISRRPILAARSFASLAATAP